MKLIEVGDLDSTEISPDGSITLRLKGEDGEATTVHFPPDLAKSLAGGLAQGEQTLRSAEGEAFQARPGSVRILFHKPTSRALIRFDEGKTTEANYSLSPDQIPEFARQASDCLNFFRARSQN